MTTMEPAPPSPTTPVTPAAPVVVTPRARQGGRWLNILLALAFAVALGGVAFAVGRSTAPVAAATIRGNGGAGFVPGGSFAPGGANGQGRGGPLGAGGGLTVGGTVESIANGKLTVKLASGDTMTFNVDGSTTYRSATPATATDVAVGDSVDVGVTGGRAAFGGGGATSSAAPDLTARDVTVVR